jgi:hypothetical protein
VNGRRTSLWCAWLAWSRFRVVLAVWDRTLPTIVACMDTTLRRLDGVPTYALPENVPRNIFGLLWPGALCGRGPAAPTKPR